ncbi:hypothetical protein ABVN55_03135 [Fusobacterium animalis]|nr:hypothetical protein [Fusobacterium nucleatum]
MKLKVFYVIIYLAKKYDSKIVSMAVGTIFILKIEIYVIIRFRIII